jgi:hypothetical protein
MRTLLSFLMLFVVIGCGGTYGDRELLKSSDDKVQSLGKEVKEQNQTLSTLGSSTKNLDLAKVLTKKAWEKISINLDKFYTTPTQTQIKEYKIDMKFEDSTVLAYADCQKLTATYRVQNNKVQFFNIQYSPAIELATCIESKDADKAVYELMLQDFEVTDIKEKQITFKSYIFDTDVILKR